MSRICPDCRVQFYTESGECPICNREPENTENARGSSSNDDFTNGGRADA